ncbi:hypothetical protein JCM10213_005300 [Rhodosporidiobolus nylandii]
MPPRTAVAYAALVVLRAVVAFTSTSTIHPDEHFQNPEIAAGLLFDYGDRGDGLLQTWEWTGEAPCRSIVPVLGSTGFAFALLRALTGRGPTARALFLTQRCMMLVFSFAIDLLIHLTARSDTAVLLFASSPVVFTFLVRPFSNSLEALFFALALYVTLHTVKRTSCTSLSKLGAILALGVFTRVTFVAFAAPLVIAVAYRVAARLAWRNHSVPASLALLRASSPAALTFILTSCLLAFVDTFYFSSSASLSSFILTPLNLLRYNLASANLAEHGLHPRYLHLAANWPMLFGPGLAVVWLAARARMDEEKAGAKDRFRLNVYFASFLVPTLLLSIQPHQEPRFLVPLIIPLALLTPYASFFRSDTSRARKIRRVFCALWLVHSLVLTALFGYLHQGGLIRSLFALSDALQNPSSALGEAEKVNIVFWRTFMPPRHLLLPTSRGDALPPAVNITDLAGAPSPDMLATLSLLSAASPVTSSTLLVAPAYNVDALALACPAFLPPRGENTRPCLRPLFDGRTFGVHVDMDRLGDLVRAKGWSRTGIGVWEVEGK